MRPSFDCNRGCGMPACTRSCSLASVPSARCAWEVGRCGATRDYDGPTMPTTARPLSRRRFAALAVALASAAAGTAGCAASSGGGGGADPAALVPANAPLYVEAVLRGDGQEQRDAQAALGKILRTADPQGEIVRIFDQRARGRVQFARDVEPWLGDRVGAAALSFGRRDGDKVVVAASHDNAKARDALERIAPNAAQRTYRDVDYRVDTDSGRAAAVVGDSVVLGTENGLKAAIDASKGSSLAEADALKQARSTVRQERSGFLYVDVAGFLRSALSGAGGGAAQFAPLADTVAQALPRTVAAALDAEPGLLRVDSAALGNGGLPLAASGADALAALPADAWLGLGVGELGQSVNGFLDRIASAGGLAGVGLEALLGQVQQQLGGLDVRRDLLGWMGDAGVYVAGTSGDDARAALVIASKDPEATRRAVRALESVARQGGDVVPLSAPGIDEGFAVRRPGQEHELLVAAGGDKFVVALGRRALDEALDPGAGLATAPAFRDAAAKLGAGVRPSFFVDVQKLSGLVAAKGGSSDHARELREYLGAFGAVIGGARRDGDTTRGEAVATLP
jgi:Protein of unknown function (DUF3352)